LSTLHAMRLELSSASSASSSPKAAAAPPLNGGGGRGGGGADAAAAAAAAAPVLARINLIALESAVVLDKMQRGQLSAAAPATADGGGE
jgi:hypothetical protein